MIINNVIFNFRIIIFSFGGDKMKFFKTRLFHLSIIIIMLLFLTSCIETNFYIKIYPNGYARFRIKYQSEFSEMIYSLEESLVESDYTIIARGYKNGKYYITGEWYGKISSKVFSIAKMDERVKNINSDFKGGKKFGIFYNYYTYKAVISRNKSLDYDEDAELGLYILKTMPVRFIITLPGEIVDTNGKKTSKNTVIFYYTMADFYTRDITLYAKSRTSKVKSIFNAQTRAENKIMDYEYKIGEMRDEIKKMNARIKRLEYINRNLEKMKKQADRHLVDTLNILVEIYYLENDRYPDSLDNLEALMERIGYDEIPQPFEGTLNYDPKSHRVKIIKGGESL